MYAILVHEAMMHAMLVPNVRMRTILGINVIIHITLIPNVSFNYLSVYLSIWSLTSASYIWLSAKRCVCNGWLGCAENKSCLKKYFVMSVGWMCVKMNEDIVEIIAAEILKRFGKYLIKCDFTAEIQPRKTDSGTEPVSVGVVWLTKTKKSYIYHICYVHERSFYKIHASEKLPLNYAFVESISNFICSSSVS